MDRDTTLIVLAVIAVIVTWILTRPKTCHNRERFVDGQEYPGQGMHNEMEDYYRKMDQVEPTPQEIYQEMREPNANMGTIYRQIRSLEPQVRPLYPPIAPPYRQMSSIGRAKADLNGQMSDLYHLADFLDPMTDETLAQAVQLSRGSKCQY